MRTRQFPHAPTPTHTECVSGLARVTTPPDVHVALRKLRRRAKTPATSISELSQEREMKGEVAGASHQGPVLLKDTSNLRCLVVLGCHSNLLVGLYLSHPNYKIVRRWSLEYELLKYELLL